jgi:hypothetical protein
MRGLICALFIGALLAVAHAVDRPDWAFPVADKIEPPSKDDSPGRRAAPRGGGIVGQGSG